MKKQLILMFSLMMLFAFTIDTATAQTTSTTKTEKVSWWKRTFGKKKLNQDTAKAMSQEKARKDVKTGGVKPAKDVKKDVDVVKSTKKKKTKKATKKDIPNVKKKYDGKKPYKDTKTKTTETTDGPTKAKKDVKKKDIPKVSDRVKKDKTVPTTEMEAPAKPGKGKVKTKKNIPDNSKGKVREVEGERDNGSPHPSKFGKAQCGVKGCEHPGKHAGLHKDQNPVRPYVKTAQGYQEMNNDGTTPGGKPKTTTPGGKKIKKIKGKN